MAVASESHSGVLATEIELILSAGTAGNTALKHRCNLSDLSDVTAFVDFVNRKCDVLFKRGP